MWNDVDALDGYKTFCHDFKNQVIQQEVESWFGPEFLDNRRQNFV